MTRVPYLAGNWKMNLDRRRALELVSALVSAVGDDRSRSVAVFPSFVYIDEVARAAAGSAVEVGAQDVSDEPYGAFTGEVSVEMLKDVGARSVIVGHSERRHLYGETDDLVNRKLRAVLAGGLKVVLCVGETLEERRADRTEAVTGGQLTEGLAGVSADELDRITVAYEPVWAIGTGQTASPIEVSAAHTYLRGVLSGLYDQGLADTVRIQYGGSVKPDNISELMAVPDVDGALVGGASLKAESFLKIVQYA